MLAGLISVGSELTAGITADTNAAWLARRLGACGVAAVRHVTVADDRKAIAEELRRASAWAQVVLVTGGLGPTDDDVTREALAEAMGAALRTDAAVLEHLHEFFRSRGYPWTESNARQATFPQGSTVIENLWGTAPGIRAVINDAAVYCLPGVPREMRQMFVHYVQPEIERHGGTGAIVSQTLWCFGAGESRIAEKIADLMRPGRAVTVGTTAIEGLIGIRFLARASNWAEAEALIHADEADVRRRLGHLVFGAEDETLESAVAGLLRRQHSTVSTAESCTGGLLAKRLTDIPGSSEYFLRGLVTYSDQAKTDLLGVAARLIEQHGAVSGEVAEAMAISCRKRAGSDSALAITGIAGPSGGSSEKPVGLVYIALASHDGCQVRCFTFGGHLSRDSIRRRSSSAALNLLRRRLMDSLSL
ncbi:MAG: competence/damage-inducible protein A [Planctomycetota bacterium]|jgi:nicotinamide-nucleotide amidase